MSEFDRYIIRAKKENMPLNEVKENLSCLLLTREQNLHLYSERSRAKNIITINQIKEYLNLAK